MKLIFISVIFYIEAIVFEALLYFIMKMPYDSVFTAYLARRAERHGERLYNLAEIIEKRLRGI